MGWNTFFHSRFGLEGLKLVGWLRMFYAVLFVVDRLCMGIDFDFLFSPTHGGVLNYHIGQQNPNANVPGLWTLFALAPDSEALLWGLHYAGLVQGILLFLGVAPKFQLICLYINLISFQHHNFMLWDGEDRMFKLWAFLFLFFPMHTVTIFDSFGKNMKKEETWPMWPVRLFQLEMTLIYMGASMSKLSSQSWIDGTAMYWISYTTDYYPGVFNPDVLFNRLFPLKVLCWSAVLLETAGWTLVWIPQTRWWTVVGMFALHMGIEISMNMYAFEWLAMIGWSVFLIQPSPSPTAKADANKDKKKVVPPSGSSHSSSRIGNVLVVTILSLFAIETFPLEYMDELAPKMFKPVISQLGEYQAYLYEYVEVPLHFLGLQQGVWDMYAGEYPDSSNCYYRADLHYNNDTTMQWDSPDWIRLPWWERKIKMRLMNYYDSAETPEAAASWVAFAKYLQRQYSSSDSDDDSMLTSVDLYLRCEYGVDFHESTGWFEPIRQPMEEEISLLVTVDICGDDFSECEDWMENGLCSEYAEGMRLYCQQSCEICDDYIVTWPSREHAEYTVRTGDEIYASMYTKFPPPHFFEENVEEYDGDDVESPHTYDEDDDKIRGSHQQSVMSLQHGTALGFCVFIAIAFVGSLYIFVPHSVQALDRNDPRQIKWRSLATGVVCLGAWVGQAYLLQTAIPFPPGVESIRGILDRTSLAITHALISSVKVLAHVGVLYSGSILDRVIRVYTYMRQHESSDPPRRVMHQLSDFLHTFYAAYTAPIVESLQFFTADGWITWRNLIIAPFLEEMAFRTSMVPVLLAAGWDPLTICLVSPLFFGVAHAHHAFQRLREGTDPATVAITTVFQFAYTSLFGAYATHVYLQTQSTAAITAAHGFCNLMGLPNFAFFSRRYDLYEYRWILFSAHLLGLSCFAMLLFRGFLSTSSGTD